MKDAVTSKETPWRYEAPEHANRAAKSLLLTVGRVAIVGRWGNGDGVIAWAPLPKRDKKIEVDKGLL